MSHNSRHDISFSDPKRSHSKVSENSQSTLDQHDDHESKLFNFVPPLHIQRKREVLNIVMKYIEQNYFDASLNISSNLKIIDVGCERGAFFQYFQTELIGLKYKFDSTYIGIDISEFTLSNETIQNLKKFSLGDSSDVRNGSVSVKLLHENILYPSFHLDRPDLLIMIEVIEHIKLDDVNNKLPQSIFGDICPNVAIITTPNSDFNEIFGLKSRLQFRHWDHKFEWSRNEFKCWCDGVISLFDDYIYEINDIGTSKDFPLHGGGSQMAIFYRKKTQSNLMSSNLSQESIIIYEKENLFTALSEYDVIRNFISFKMSLWATEKHVSVFNTLEEDDFSDNLGTLEYDEETGNEIFKIPVNVVEKIVRMEFPNTNVDIHRLLLDCSNYSIYFKLSDDRSFICYKMGDDRDTEEEDEEDYLKKYSNNFENVQYLCGRIEDVDLTDF